MIRIPSSYDKYCSQDKQLINYKTLLYDLQLDSILSDGAYDFTLRPKDLQSQQKVENQKQLQEWQHQELNKLSRMSKRNHTRNLDQIKLRNTQYRTINDIASLKLVSTSLQEPKFKDIAQLNNQYYTLSTQYGVQNEQGDLFKNIIEQKDLQNSKISLTQSKTPQSIRTFKSSRNENFKSKLTGSIMKSLMDYGHQEPIMRKSDSPDFFKFNKERKFKPLEYFSPLKSVGQLFPQDQGVGVVEQLKNLEIDQRTLNLIRREFLKYDKESSGKIKIEEFKQIARKICSNEITKYHIKEIVKLFSKGQDSVEYSFIKTLSQLLMFWTKPPNISKNESTELRDLIQQNQNQNTQVRAHILELLNKLQAKLEQKYADQKSAFRLFDVNNSGDISQEEFQLTLDMIQMDISEDQGLEIF